MKVCLDCPKVTEGSRCPDCARKKDKARGSSTERGYGSKHQRLRAEWQARIDAGKHVYCWRCKTKRITSTTPWHLGHDDHDRTKYMGPECIPCNTRTAARRGAP